MRSRTKIIFLVFAFILSYAVLNTDLDIDRLTGDTTLDSDGQIPSEISKAPIVLFCPRDSCGQNLAYMINSSEKVHCAFFDLDIPEVIGALEMKNALVVVDADNFKAAEGKITNLRKDTRTAFMHNKFCVFDDRMVLTGSFNPTKNGDEKNDNDVIVISSEHLAENYEAEFQELWDGRFGEGDTAGNPIITLNNNKIENYFCPEDWCANKVLKALSYANESIYFMTFSFTHDQIGDLLLEKHNQGVEIRGVFEKSQNSQYSEFEKLKRAGADVVLDRNPAAMHHKVFIIDNKTVITGSFNPTKNADTKNDENLLILYDPHIAQEYLSEFEYITQN